MEKNKTYKVSSYENKEVRVYSIDDKIYIDWYIDGKLINPKFSKEIIIILELYVQTLLGKHINERLLCEIRDVMGTYLSELEEDYE